MLDVFVMGRSKWAPVSLFAILLFFVILSFPKLAAGAPEIKYAWILENGSGFPGGVFTKVGDTYYLQRNITDIAIWKSDVKIDGQGYTLTIPTQGYTNSGMWTLGGPDRIEIRNLRIEGEGTGASMFLGNRLSPSESDGIVLENCHLIQCSFGVYGNNASLNYNVVENGKLTVFQPWSPGYSTIFNNELHNSSIAAGLNKVFVCGNLVESGDGSGIMLDSTSECYVIGNTVIHTSKGENIQYYPHHGGDGIYSIRSGFNVIAANRILGNAGSGINIDTPMADNSVNVVWGNVIASNDFGFNLSTPEDSYRAINIVFNNNFEYHPGNYTSALWHQNFWDVGDVDISVGEIPGIFEQYVPEYERDSIRQFFEYAQGNISWLIQDFIQGAPLKSGITLEDVPAYLESGNPEELLYGNFWHDHTLPDANRNGVVDDGREIDSINIDNFPLADRFELDDFYGDVDSDGVVDYIEGLVVDSDGDGRGDGNGDGTDDNSQADVASLSTMGEMRVFATLQTSAGDLVNVRARPAPPGQTDNMPYGAFAFEVHGVPGGGSVDLDLYLPRGLDLDQLWKEIGGIWTEIDNAVFSTVDNKMQISFSITDNGPLDGNGVDGIITDDFAPAFGVPEVFYPGLVALLCMFVSRRRVLSIHGAHA
jgi:hypothetical protein